MNQTETHGLSQWEAQDRILREDFNADNAKTEDALAGLATRTANLESTCASLGNCAVYTETYEGTGKTETMTRTFPGKPVAIMVGSSFGYAFVACRGMPTVYPHYISNGLVTISLTWGETSVSWIGSSASDSMNGNTTYYLMALLDMSA